MASDVNVSSAQLMKDHFVAVPDNAVLRELSTNDLEQSCLCASNPNSMADHVQVVPDESKRMLEHTPPANKRTIVCGCNKNLLCCPLSERETPVQEEIHARGESKVLHTFLFCYDLSPLLLLRIVELTLPDLTGCMMCCAMGFVVSEQMPGILFLFLFDHPRFLSLS